MPWVPRSQSSGFAAGVKAVRRVTEVESVLSSERVIGEKRWSSKALLEESQFLGGRCWRGVAQVGGCTMSERSFSSRFLIRGVRRYRCSRGGICGLGWRGCSRLRRGGVPRIWGLGRDGSGRRTMSLKMIWRPILVETRLLNGKKGMGIWMLLRAMGLGGGMRLVGREWRGQVLGLRRPGPHRFGRPRLPLLSFQSDHQAWMSLSMRLLTGIETIAVALGSD